MKLIIDIPDYDYSQIYEYYENNDIVEAIYSYIANGTPLTECEDTISRQDAVSRISDLLMLELQGKRLPTWNEVYNALGELPSVQPKAKTGHWIDNGDGFTEHYGQLYTCSECGNTSIGKQDFCKDCGAYMRDIFYSYARGNLKTADFIQRCVDFLDEIDVKNEDKK